MIPHPRLLVGRFAFAAIAALILPPVCTADAAEPVKVEGLGTVYASSSSLSTVVGNWKQYVSLESPEDLRYWFNDGTRNGKTISFPMEKLVGWSTETEVVSSILLPKRDPSAVIFGLYDWDRAVSAVAIWTPRTSSIELVTLGEFNLTPACCSADGSVIYVNGWGYNEADRLVQPLYRFVRGSAGYAIEDIGASVLDYKSARAEITCCSRDGKIAYGHVEDPSLPNEKGSYLLKYSASAGITYRAYVDPRYDATIRACAADGSSAYGNYGGGSGWPLLVVKSDLTAKHYNLPNGGQANGIVSDSAVAVIEDSSSRSEDVITVAYVFDAQAGGLKRIPAPTTKDSLSEVVPALGGKSVFGNILRSDGSGKFIPFVWDAKNGTRLLEPLVNSEDFSFFHGASDDGSKVLLSKEVNYWPQIYVFDRNNPPPPKDKTAPRLVSATIGPGGATLTLVFSENVKRVRVPSVSLGGRAVGTKLLKLEPKKHVYSLARRAYKGEVSKATLSAGSVRDAAGNPNAAIARQVVNGSTVRRKNSGSAPALSNDRYRETGARADYLAEDAKASCEAALTSSSSPSLSGSVGYAYLSASYIAGLSAGDEVAVDGNSAAPGLYEYLQARRTQEAYSRLAQERLQEFCLESGDAASLRAYSECLDWRRELLLDLSN